MKLQILSNKLLAIGLVCALLTFETACNTWPTIIATAQAMSLATSVFYPSVASFSGLAVNLLQQGETAYQAYQANKNAGTEAAYVAAIQSIETDLPQDFATLNIPAADQTKVSAVVSIILDFVEAEAGQVPATSSLVAHARAARNASPLPKPMTKSQIKARWATDVCNHEAKCVALLK